MIKNTFFNTIKHHFIYNYYVRAEFDREIAVFLPE